MKSEKKGVAVAGVVLLVGLWVGGALAQEVELVEDESGTGVHVYADSSGGSVLSQAARMGGSVVITADESDPRQPRSTGPETAVHLVKKGDTLWGICEGVFGDPYVWPRIWSYNPEITNPNWIYPGDQVMLIPGGAMTLQAATPGGGMDGGMGMPIAPPTLGNAVLLRNRGFVDTKTLERSGEIVGAHKPTILLAQLDEAYVEFPEETSPRPGDEFAAFQVLDPVDSVEDPGTDVGRLVEILGLVRVTKFDDESRIARVVIDEVLRPIERGTMVGPVHRRFDLVSPVANDRDLDGHLVAFLDPTVLAATHQVVFIDRGKEQGVRDGNRFFAVERRDRLRESWGEPDDREGYPVEIIAEMRVVETRPNTATCLVTSAVRELEIGQRVEMREGY